MNRIQLPNAEFEGENSVYLFDGEPTTLVDTGVATPDTEDALRAGLDRHGVAVADLDEIILTHWHADHAGLAGRFQSESDATVRIHAADAPMVGDPDAWDAYGQQLRDCFADWGVPDEKQSEVLAVVEESGVFGDRPTVTAFEDGDRLQAGDEQLRVVHVPGHTAGCSCLLREGQNEILSADALLPEYTPNIGGADVRVEEPLATYVESLDRLAAAEFDRAYPGHRDPIDDPTARAREIVSHHRDRTRRVIDALDRIGPASPWSLAGELFGELSGIHAMHGPGESFAHLDHLRRRGAVERTNDGYVLDDDPKAALDGTRLASE